MLRALTDAVQTGQWWAAVLVLLALVVFGTCAVVLVVADVREHRLPNRWTLRLAAGGMITLGAAALALGEPGRLASALGGAVAYLVVLALLHLASRQGLGMGDVKLAGGLGVYAGWLGWEQVLTAGILAFVVGGLLALGLILARRATGSTHLPFGPPMILGAAAVLVLG